MINRKYKQMIHNAHCDLPDVDGGNEACRRIVECTECTYYRAAYAPPASPPVNLCATCVNISDCCIVHPDITAPVLDCPDYEAPSLVATSLCDTCVKADDCEQVDARTTVCPDHTPSEALVFIEPPPEPLITTTQSCFECVDYDHGLDECIVLDDLWNPDKGLNTCTSFERKAPAAHCSFGDGQSCKPADQSGCTGCRHRIKEEPADVIAPDKRGTCYDCTHFRAGHCHSADGPPVPVPTSYSCASWVDCATGKPGPIAELLALYSCENCESGDCHAIWAEIDARTDLVCSSWLQEVVPNTCSNCSNTGCEFKATQPDACCPQWHEVIA